MGLDMYLEAQTYIAGYDHNGAVNQALCKEILTSSMLDKIADPGTPTVKVVAVAAYWRKSNQIHKWFVDNVQGGADDCGRYYVEREQIQALIDLCKQTLSAKDNATALENLPPQRGFFFGSTEVDEYYWQDLQETVERLELVLANAPAEVDFYYHSSW